MRYKLIVLDIDGTITRHISSWQLIHEKLNMWNEKASLYQDQFLSRRISYKRFCQLDATCWKGMPESKIASLFEPVDYMKNAKACLRKLKKRGFMLAAISTGLQYIAQTIKNELSFDYVLSNILLSRKNILTGGVKINVSHNLKARALQDICRRCRVKTSEVISIGDSAGDIPLAEKSGYSIAFNCSDKKLADLVDYNCRTNDFIEVYDHIIDIETGKPVL
jgi:phosphoserine phosphatase